MQGPFQSTLAALAALALTGAASNALAEDPAPPPPVIRYTLQWHDSGTRPELRVRIDVPAGDRAHLSFALPAAWGGTADLAQGVSAIASTSPGTRVDRAADGRTFTLVPAPGSPASVEYVVTQIADHPPTSGDRNFLAPILQPTWLHVIGRSILATPTGAGDDLQVHAELAGLPDSWSMASGVGVGAQARRFDGTLEHLLSTEFVAGDFRIASRTTAGGRISVALRGRWPFDDATLMSNAQDIVELERRFWDDTAARDLLVVLLPLATRPGASSRGGTAFDGSLALFVDEGTPQQTLEPLLAHEYFHTWNTRALGGADERGARLFWFTEGFTEYFAQRLRTESGQQPLAAWAGYLSEVLQKLSDNPRRTESNEDIALQFFSDRDANDIPYLRGALLALRWNREIRQASHGAHSLSDAMPELLRAHARTGEPVGRGPIADAVQPLGVQDPRGDIRRFIDEGAMPVFDPSVTGRCLALQKVDYRTFDAGFDIAQAVPGSRVGGVLAGGPADAAGLRDSQAIRWASWDSSNPAVPARIAIADGAGTRVIEYAPFPLRHTQGFAVRPSLGPEDLAACLKDL
jgi:predicted metalloprotease with PDZ domain